MEVVNRAHLHLLDLILGVSRLLQQRFLRLVDLLQQLLHLAELLLKKSGARGGRGIQLFLGQQRQAAQLVASAGRMGTESRCSKLHSRVNDTCVAMGVQLWRSR